MKEGYDSLVALGISVGMADALYEKGFYSAEELRNASIEDMCQVRGVSEEEAQKIIELAKGVKGDGWQRSESMNLPKS